MRVDVVPVHEVKDDVFGYPLVLLPGLDGTLCVWVCSGSEEGGDEIGESNLGSPVEEVGECHNSTLAGRGMESPAEMVVGGSQSGLGGGWEVFIDE